MKNILIIEDDFYIRGLYKIAFEKAGYQVVEAEDGESALKKIKEQKFDFVILDLMLPGIPGIEVLRKIKKFQEAPIYVLTNVGDEETLIEAKKVGAKANFLKVDYTPKQLVAAIEKEESAK